MNSGGLSKSVVMSLIAGTLGPVRMIHSTGVMASSPRMVPMTARGRAGARIGLRVAKIPINPSSSATTPSRIPEQENREAGKGRNETPMSAHHTGGEQRHRQQTVKECEPRNDHSSRLVSRISAACGRGFRSSSDHFFAPRTTNCGSTKKKLPSSIARSIDASQAAISASAMRPESCA